MRFGQIPEKLPILTDNGHVWGRPVGVTVAQDGALLVTDDGSGSIWRITDTGK